MLFILSRQILLSSLSSLMNHCTSLESLKQFITNIFSKDEVLPNLHSDGFSLIKHYLNPLEPCVDYETAFLHSLYYVLLEDGANFILLLRYVECVNLRNGLLFYKDNVDISDSLNNSDLTFVFLLFLFEQSTVESQHLCCISLLREFCCCDYYSNLHSFSMKIYLSYCFTSFQSDFICDDFYIFMAELLTFTCESSQFCLWSNLEDIFQYSIRNFGSRKPWLFINSLFQISSISNRLKECLYAHILLPLIEKSSSIRTISSYSHILNALRLLIQRIYIVFPKEQFVLWLECMQYCHCNLISTCEDVDSIILMLMYSIQSFSLSIPQINNCLLICSNLLPMSPINQHTYSCLINVICSLFVNSLFRTNRTIVKRSLNLLMKLPSISCDSQVLLIHSLLFLDSYLIQCDIDHAISYSVKSSRSLCLQLLLSFPISFHDVINWLVIPLYCHSMGLEWLSEEDVQRIIRQSLSQATSLLVSQDRIVMYLVYTILSSFPCSSSLLDNESRFFYDTVFSLNEDTFSSSLYLSFLPYICKQLLLKNKETWIEPFLLDCFHNDSVYWMNGDGSDVLCLSASLSFSRLQELLIACSCHITSDSDLLIVLKLLFAVNSIVFNKYHHIALERDDHTLERELISSYYQSGILSCYLPLLTNLFDSFQDEELTSCQCQVIIQSIQIVKQISIHCLNRDWESRICFLLSYRSSSYLFTILPIAVSILFEITSDEMSLLPKVNQLVEYYSSHSFLNPLFLVLNRIFDAVVSNAILDCFVESLLIACYYDCLTRDQISNYLHYLFQANTKSNQKEFVAEVLGDWRDMEFENKEKKQEILEIFYAIICGEMKMDDKCLMQQNSS